MGYASQRLVTYLVLSGNDAVGDAESAEPGVISQALSSQLRHLLQRHLPAYMMPAAFVRLKALPLTLHGKVDRKALPPPGVMPWGEEGQAVVPRTPLEAILTEIWADVLGVDAVGVQDDFFTELGGHSLLATQLISQIRKRFQVALPLSSIFEAPVIADFAAVLELTMQGEEPSSG